MVLVSVVLPTDPRAVLVPSQRFSLSHDTMIQGRVIHSLHSVTPQSTMI